MSSAACSEGDVWWRSSDRGGVTVSRPWSGGMKFPVARSLIDEWPEQDSVKLSRNLRLFAHTFSSPGNLLSIRGGSKGTGRHVPPSKPQVIVYKHNTTSSCTVLQVHGHYGDVPSRDSLYYAYIILPHNATTKRNLLSERRWPRIGWRRASFCKSIATTFQNRLPLWTISLALEPADCVLYFKTKMAGNIKRWVDEMMIILSYNASLY